MGMLHGEFVVVDAPPAMARQETEPVASEVQITPAAAQSPPESDAMQTYTIRRGDTLRAIAKRLYKDERRWRDIAVANPGLNPRKLREGRSINLPGCAPP
jgi:nucleoid-associated protein YgaU